MELGKTITLSFIISDPATGSPIDADSLPLVDVFEDTAVDPMYEPLSAKRGVLDGHYYTVIVATAANGFEKGKSYNVSLTATVAGVTAKMILVTLFIDDVMDKLTSASLLVNIPVDPTFEPVIDDFAEIAPMSMSQVFGAESEHPHREIFERYFDITTGQWQTDTESVVPGDFNSYAGDPIAAYASIAAYNESKAAYDAEYALQREIQWKEYVAQKLIDNTEV
jgi:hypothetical protein